VVAVALRVVAAWALLLVLRPALAHVAAEGALPGAADRPWAPGAWAGEAWVIGSVGLAAAMYLLGLRRLWRHAGAGRGVAPRQAMAFAAGWLAVVLALLSPLDGLGVRLFWAHMAQHELLMVVAAPLLVLGRPLAVWAWALPAGWRPPLGRALRGRAWRGAWKAITGAFGAWVLHALALWAWHVPAAFEAALHHAGLHALQHASFLASALLFWWAVWRAGLPRAGAPGSPQRLGHALALLFTTMLHSGALGALLALSPQAWYATYAATAPAAGWDPLVDQQLGGLLMWAPAGLAYAAAALLLVGQALGRRGPQWADEHVKRHSSWRRAGA
jgi:putative membrane protein